MSENLWRMAVAEFGSITGILIGEIGTEEIILEIDEVGDKTEGDRSREHCI